MDDGLAHHPLIAAAFSPPSWPGCGPRRLSFPRVVVELDAMPPLASHGDACPNNLLIHPDSSDITLIDFGFFWPPTGRLRPHPAPGGRGATRPSTGLGALRRRTRRFVGPTCAGCSTRASPDRTRGPPLPCSLLMMVFCGLSAYPFGLLDQPRSPGHGGDRHRAGTLAGFILDLVEATTE